MKVYKYRNINAKHLEALSENYFYAPTFEKLNDPCETTFCTKNFFKTGKLITNYLLGSEANKNRFKEYTEDVKDILSTRNFGIYSLSSTFDNELLWAHYSDSHRGFCIEYDLDLLLNSNNKDEFHSFNVKYNSKPPKFNFVELSSKLNPFNILKKITGYKSRAWEYEKEVRIICDRHGKNSYDYKAVTAIYFGCRTNLQQKHTVMKALQGRGVIYYQMEFIPNTYKLQKIQIVDEFKDSPFYLTEFSLEDSSTCKFTFIAKKYLAQKRKAIINIELEKEVSDLDLKVISNKIKNEIYSDTRFCEMTFFIKDGSKDSWATSVFLNDKLDRVSYFKPFTW